MNATLEELENQIWGEPEFESHLVVTCHELRRKPLEQFTVEDLRIMIGQNIGLKHLMPRALDVLKRTPFAEGDYYPGDLLTNVISAESEYFQNNLGVTCELVSVCKTAIQQIDRNEIELYSLKEDMQHWLTIFINKYPAKLPV